MAINTLIQMPYEWLNTPIIKITTRRYVVETLGNVIKTLKYLQNHSQRLLLHKLAEQSTSGLGRFLECQKYNILVITQALVLCLIYTYSPLSTVRPQVSCVYIRQSILACVKTYAYNT